MNSGRGDAIDLAWKLEAVIKGCGGSNLLPLYEWERRQIGDRNIGASRYASLGQRKWCSMWKPNIEDNSAEGQQTREVLTMIADIEQRKTNEMIGAEMGYRYADSPIILDIPGGPEHSFREYIPSTWLDARLPNVWLADGSPIQDHIAEGYTILRLDNKNIDVSALTKAFQSCGAPTHILDIPDRVARKVYGFDLILVRPDLHIVWRGQKLPDDVQNIARIATGHI